MNQIENIENMTVCTKEILNGEIDENGFTDFKVIRSYNCYVIGIECITKL